MDIEINIGKLRAALMNYYGTAMTGGEWPAIADLSGIEYASPQELIRIAEREGVDLKKYEVEQSSRQEDI